MFYEFEEAIQAVVGRIVSDTDDLCSRIGRLVHDEDDFTSRMADRIEQSVNGVFVGGMKWEVTTRKLPWRGPKSEESRFGADLGLVLRMSGWGFDVTKGYLIQGKMVEKLNFEFLEDLPFSKGGSCLHPMQGHAPNHAGVIRMALLRDWNLDSACRVYGRDRSKSHSQDAPSKPLWLHDAGVHVLERRLPPLRPP